MAKYESSSRNAKVGDGFKDHVLKELNDRFVHAVDFRTYLISRGYSERDTNIMENLEGDIFLPDFHVFLECKTSEKYRDSVTIKAYPLTCFSGPHKFYVTSYFDGENYVNVKVHPSRIVKENAVDRESFFTFDTTTYFSRSVDEFLDHIRRVPR